MCVGRIDLWWRAREQWSISGCRRVVGGSNKPLLDLTATRSLSTEIPIRKVNLWTGREAICCALEETRKCKSPFADSDCPLLFIKLLSSNFIARFLAEIWVVRAYSATILELGWWAIGLRTGFWQYFPSKARKSSRPAHARNQAEDLIQIYGVHELITALKRKAFSTSDIFRFTTTNYESLLTIWDPWPDFKFALVWQVLVSSCSAPSLTRGRACSLQCNHSLVRVAYYQVPVFISPRNRVAQLYPRALGSLLSPLTTLRDYDGGILTHLHTGF
jgi:hypothetical protein